MMLNRVAGPYWSVFLGVMVCNVLAPQMFWSKRMRHSIPVLFTVAMAVNLGMWLERYMIVVVSLHRDFVPAAWGMYAGTIWDYAALFGSIGLFLALLFLFIRFLPVISIFEMRALVQKTSEEQ
jgi:hypothetical protein